MVTTKFDRLYHKEKNGNTTWCKNLFFKMSNTFDVQIPNTKHLQSAYLKRERNSPRTGRYENKLV